jgi:uncharacterized membrane protein
MGKSIRSLLLLFSVAALMAASGITALADEQSKSIKEVVAEIRQTQNLEPGQKIDCKKVTDKQLEELGDAWMDIMIPDPEQHEMMDRMMGGPGSESLASAHRMMGARYLGCIQGGPYGGGMMMMPGMMSIMGNFGPGGMMHGYYDGWMHSWGGGIFMWIIFLIVIGVIVYLIVVAGRSRHYYPTHGSPGESAQDILKKRYARGEISKDDYERMKKDIS